MKRSELMKWADAVTGFPVVGAARPPASALKIRDLPAVQALEDYLLFHGAVHADNVLRDTARKVFGVALVDLLAMRREVADEGGHADEFDDRFETGDHLTDDETVVVLGRFGLDFTDLRGHPLRCTKALAWPAEAAAKGIAGSLPSRANVDTEKWGDSLASDAEAFLRKKRGGDRR